MFADLYSIDKKNSQKASTCQNKQKAVEKQQKYFVFSTHT